MVIYGVYVVSKSGGLIFQHDHVVVNTEHERRWEIYPPDVRLRPENKRLIVEWCNSGGGETRPGHTLLSINGTPVTGRQLEDGQDVLQLIEDPASYPLSLRFGRPRTTTNEKIFLASMFYPLFAIASQLSPEPRSSGIEVLEADTFRLHCFQTLTGVKLMCVCDPQQVGVEPLLRKLYELYADYALKNPFYSLEMPIRCELFETNLAALLEQADSGRAAQVSGV